MVSIKWILNWLFCLDEFDRVMVLFIVLVSSLVMVSFRLSLGLWFVLVFLEWVKGLKILVCFFKGILGFVFLIIKLVIWDL